ncbi:MAG: glucokinase [Gammaproteobacteria bacterium]|nr:glucokinase [Gammaproteobacteria bacterium]
MPCDPATSPTTRRGAGGLPTPKRYWPGTVAPGRTWNEGHRRRHRRHQDGAGAVHLQGPGFMTGFLNKGRMAGLLARVPVKVVMNPGAALLGAARHAVATGSNESHRPALRP